MSDVPTGATPINIPAQFLAEHGRVSLENSELRRALDEAQRTIQMLVEKLKEGTETVEHEVEGVLPIIRRKPEPAGATTDAS